MDLAVEAIIKAEGLEASDEDVENEMKSVAEKYGMDLDTVKKYLRPGGREGAGRPQRA